MTPYICIIDVETGGLYPHKNPLYEVAAMMLDDTLTSIGTLQFYVHPDRWPCPNHESPYAREMHKDKNYPDLCLNYGKDPYTEIMTWIREDINPKRVLSKSIMPAGWNVNFDRAFINAQGSGVWDSLFGYRTFDIQSLYFGLKHQNRIFQQLQYIPSSLESIAQALGIIETQTHNAMDDVELTATILRRIYGSLG